MDIKIFGERLKELRIEKNLTQEQLANSLNISNKMLSKYERGESIADIELLYIISKYFNVTTDYLLGLTDNRNSKILNPPKKLKDVGIEYLEVISDAKASDISANDIQDIIDLLKKKK